MKILLVGATGTIGTAVAHKLEARHEVLCASHTGGALTVDLADPLMGQVNLVRLGIELVANGGSFTLTSGIASRQPMPGGAVISLVMPGWKDLYARRHWSSPVVSVSMQSLPVGCGRRSWR